MAASTVSLAKANSTFSLALFKTLSKKDKTANIFYSPFSISSALAMVLLGARGNTATQMSQVLGFTKGDQPEESAEQQRQPIQMEQVQMQIQQSNMLPDFLRQPPQSGAPAADDAAADEVHAKFGELLGQLNETDAPYALSVANRLYGEKSFQFLLEFLAEIEKNYRAGLESVDFLNDAEEARVKINTWVEKNTQGKIKDLLRENVLNIATKLVLVNAIYFKAKWEQPFEKFNTTDSTFRLNKNNTVPVKMMRQKGWFSYRIIPELNIKVLEMPYKDGSLSMIILLPEDIEDDSTGLEKLEKELFHQNFVDWTRRDGMNQGMVDVMIPIFKLSQTYDLKEVLKEMGMSDAFSSKCDLSGMSPVSGLVLSKVVHKAYVGVNEEGTEAAAATAVTMRMTSGPLGAPIPFIVDHPFLFFIRHNPSKSVLFSGRFCSPE